MRIDHIAMYVSDLEKSRAFYEKYFGAVSNERYHNLKTGLSTYFLSFDNDTRLEIMSRSECSVCGISEYAVGFTHLAFGTGSRKAVDSLTLQLEKDGYTVIGRPRVTGDGYYESVVLDIDGNRIEIME